MRSVSTSSRVLWQLAAVFQLLLPAFASVADSRAEAASAIETAVAHVESTGSTSCPRVHPTDCAICRLLTTGATPTPVASVLVPVARVIEAEYRRTLPLPRFARAPGDPPQRAPPA